MTLKDLIKKLKRLHTEIVIAVILSILHGILLLLISYILVTLNEHNIEVPKIVYSLEPDLQVS
jgi:hypothetical protein